MSKKATVTLTTAEWVRIWNAVDEAAGERQEEARILMELRGLLNEASGLYADGELV